LALYKEQFVQQIAHLKRFEEQNPGQEDSDRLANNLQSVRNECAELRNHLESIRSDHSQNFEAALRGQQAIEGNLRQIDALENENERLKERNAELQKRVEGLNDAYNQQKALQAGYRGDQLIPSELKDIAFATPQGKLRLSRQTQDHRPSSTHAHSLESGSTLKNHRVLDGHRVETPEEALRKAAKGIGSHNLGSGSQVGNVAQTSSEKVANYVETPQIRNQEVLNERSTNFNTPNADGRSMPHAQRQGSGARPLKVAGRKHGRFSQSNGTGAVPHHLNPTDPPAQSFQEAYTGSSCFADATDIQGSSGIKPFTTLASSIPTPSPFTDLSSMMDHLKSTPDQEQLQEGYAKARGKKGSMASDNVAGTGVLQTFVQRTMRSLEERDVELDAVHKSQVRVKPPSAAEEALRRRTVQPCKPALRKPTLSNDTVSSSEPRPVTITEPSKISTRAGSKVASQIQNGHRGSYNRAVSGGKPQTPKAKNPSAARESTQGTSNGEKDSPNIPPVKRNSLKRSGSSTAQTQAAPKRVRTSRGSSMAGRVEVPDSQGTQTF
jgi:myosin heavy subunit